MAELRIWQIKEIRPNKHIRKDSSEHAQLDVKPSTLHEYQGSLTTNVKKQQNAELKHAVCQANDTQWGAIAEVDRLLSSYLRPRLIGA